MPSASCHASSEPAAPAEVTNLDRAKEIILKTLGVKRVAAWCKVEEDTVYQWLSRGTDDKPVPIAHVPAIIAGAREDDLAFDHAVLWPAMALARAE